MEFLEFLKSDSKIIILFILFLGSLTLNIIQFFKFLIDTKTEYSTIAFRNMLYSTIALLFGVPIAEGLLSNFNIKLSDNGLISANTKDIYYYAMIMFCSPYIILNLGEQFKWIVIMYITTMFKTSGAFNNENTLNSYIRIIKMILKDKNNEKEKLEKEKKANNLKIETNSITEKI